MHVKRRLAGNQDEDSLATDTSPLLNAQIHRSVWVTCTTIGLAMVLIWWVWPTPLDPLTLSLSRIPFFNQLNIPARAPSWAIGVEAGLIMGLALCPAFFWRRFALPAAWAATGGLLIFVLAAAMMAWQASGFLIQVGAATLVSLLNGLIASVWVRSLNNARENADEKESFRKETEPSRPIESAVAEGPKPPPESRDEDVSDASRPTSLFRQTADSDRTAYQKGHAEKIGRYEILRLIGKGAMGEVFLGRDPRINRLTAIKTLRFEDNFAEDEIKEIKAKFFREAESAGTLSHANIVTIYDAGEDRDLAYIAMEYLEGVTLLRFTRAKRLLPVRKTIRYVTRIAEALDYAHDRGIVHRDIKPANVMILKSGDIKLTDFGIARITASSHTQTGVVKGTPYYMSPEQFSGAKVDGRSDVFSLGTMLFQVLTGSLPFFSESPAVLMNQIMNFPHPNPRAINPRVMPAIIPIVDRALEKEADRRYARAGQMARDLVHLDQRIKSYLKRKAMADAVD